MCLHCPLQDEEYPMIYDMSLCSPNTPPHTHPTHTHIHTHPTTQRFYNHLLQHSGAFALLTQGICYTGRAACIHALLLKRVHPGRLRSDFLYCKIKCILVKSYTPASTLRFFNRCFFSFVLVVLLTAAELSVTCYTPPRAQSKIIWS